MPIFRTRAARTTAVAMVAGVMLAGGAGAQDTTSCGLEPLTLPLFGGTPVAVFSTPGPAATPGTVSLTPAGAQEVLGEYAACVNTGDPTLAWAMFSPRWFAETFADPEVHDLPAFEQMLDVGVEQVVIPLELVSVDAVEPLADGRQAVTATFRSGDQEWTDRLTLVAAGEGWLIDEVEPVSPAG